MWLALDVETKEVIAVHVSGRDVQGAKGLWRKLSQVYRQTAISYTDFWSAYSQVIAPEHHQAVGKESGNKVSV
ncbi:hypothetical protein [Candidatus Cyanaurora vandensis]|uniref:hypothetical protein n=1 Tax=Candidatus Cyanaurora vandensis TaxID=2714958 RepID=UPI00257E2368|nr:hypothetical protein [Candidatus Cyanaurora vandensis]